MKTVLIFFLVSFAVFGQFKEDSENKIPIKSALTNNSASGLILSFFDPSKFSMDHSFSMSYSSFGSNGIALGVYTNTMGYQFADNLRLEVDASFVNSPYSSFGDDLTNQINGIYLSRAELNFKPSENTNIIIQYRQIPAGFGYNYGYYPYDRFMPFSNSLESTSNKLEYPNSSR